MVAMFSFPLVFVYLITPLMFVAAVLCAIMSNPLLCGRIILVVILFIDTVNRFMHNFATRNHKICVYH